MANLLSFSWEKDRDGYELLEFDLSGIKWHPDDEKKPFTAPPDASPSTLRLLERYGCWLSQPEFSRTGPYPVLAPVGEETIR